MTKRNSQATTVVVPAVHAAGVDGRGVAAKTVVVPAEAEVASAKADVKADEAPVTVVADTVVALAAPAPMAMVADPVAGQDAASAPAPQSDDSDEATDLTPYIVGGVLILGGVLAVALSSGDTDPIAVTPAPANTAPTFTSTLTATIAENAPPATIVYDANAADTQGNAIVFTIGGTDAALFNIDASTGVVTLKASANFEAKPSYSFTVTATDNGSPSLAATQTITVTVTNVNEQPTFASATATASVAENIPTTQVVFTASATDPDAVGQTAPLPAGSVITYTLGGTDAGAFNINAATGAVTFRASPDFETKSSFTFTVTATDNGATPLSSTQTVTLTVTDVTEGPVFTSGATATVAENAATSTVVYDANTAAAATFALSGADAAAFNIDTTTGFVTLRTSADFETKATYNINVVATNAAGSTTQAVVVGVTNVNEAPTVTVPTAPVTFLENNPSTTTVFTATAADVDAGAARTFSLTGPDAALFAISGTGAVTFRASPNFEATPTKTSFSVSVVVTDQGGLSVTSAPVTINVLDVNEAPTFAAPTATASVAENVATTATVFTAVATDVDSDTRLGYSISGPDAGLFNINATTGAVTFRASPNFEATPTKTSFTFTVTATDDDVPSLSGSQTVTLNLTNVNEAPTFAAATRTATLDENVAAGTVVPGSATATDVDAGATITYSLTGADAARFAINATTGVVTIVASPDFETKPTFSFNVVATDQGGATSTQAVTLNINDLPEGVRIDGAGISANTNADYNAAVGNVTFLESGAVGNISTINNFTTGDIIQTDVATSNYSFSSVGTTLVISFNNNGVSTQISLPNAAGNNFIFNEASAEQAVGFDFFRSSAPPPPASANTLAGTATLDAANAAVTYNESANSPNTTTITNFTSDDRIVVTGVSGTGNGQVYSFSSTGSDLTISFSDNGIPSQITLVGAANPNVFVFNEASAEQAVGFDFFRYG